MEISKSIKLTFEGNKEIEVPLIGELNDHLIYEIIKYDYDLSLNEKTKLTIRMEVKTLSEHEKNMVLFKIGRKKDH